MIIDLGRAHGTLVHEIVDLDLSSDYLETHM